MTAEIYFKRGEKKHSDTHVIHRTLDKVFTTFGTFHRQGDVWRWIVDCDFTLKPKWTHDASTFEHEGKYRGCQCSCGFGATSGDFDKDAAAINQHLESVHHA